MKIIEVTYELHNSIVLYLNSYFGLIILYRSYYLILNTKDIFPSVITKTNTTSHLQK